MEVTFKKMPEVTNSLAGLRKYFVLIQALPSKLSANICRQTTDVLCVSHIIYTLFTWGKKMLSHRKSIMFQPQMLRYSTLFQLKYQDETRQTDLWVENLSPVLIDQQKGVLCHNSQIFLFFFHIYSCSYVKHEDWCLLIWLNNKQTRGESGGWFSLVCTRFWVA